MAVVVQLNIAKKEKWIIYKECLKSIKHDTWNFTLFYDKFKNEQLSEFNMNYIKNQRYNIQELLEYISSIKSIFKNKFNVPFLIINRYL